MDTARADQRTDTKEVPANKKDYVIRVLNDPGEIDAQAWNELLARQTAPTPFMRHEFLLAMHESSSATPNVGWTPRFFVLQVGSEMVAACALYLKAHSYGEYVFDWAWANAYQQHGQRYYPKALIAPPFSPVPGSRLLARNESDRAALLREVIQWCRDSSLSSLHLLFADPVDIAACSQAGLMLRHALQFHWRNSETGYADFDAFLMSLSQDKRKKIRQERRKVREAGVSFRRLLGQEIRDDDWDFFYACYERNYLEHGNAPYLTRDFFHQMQGRMPEHWLMFIAEKTVDEVQTPIAASLIALGPDSSGVRPGREAAPDRKVAYGRYWGAMERVDCLHFEACYYQPLAWCIEHGYQRFEGGAQGEHKMARALMPVRTSSAHWLADPRFADAVARFLQHEEQGVEAYVDHLNHRNPFRKPD